MSSKAFLHKVFKSISALLSADFLSYLLMALFSIAYGRKLGSYQLGLYTICFTISTFARTFSELGYDYKIPREVAANPYIAGDILADAQKTKNFLWLIIFLPTVLVGWSMAKSFDFVFLILWNYTYSVAATNKAVLRGLQKMVTIAKVESVANLVLYSICFTLVFVYPELWLIFLFYAVIELLKSVVYFRILQYTQVLNLPGIGEMLKVPLSKKDIKVVVQESISQIKLLSVNIGSIIQYRSPFMAISFLSGNTMLGEFSAAMRFLTFLRVIPGAFLTTLLPEFSRKDKPTRKSIVLVLISSLLVGAFVSFALFFSSEFLIRLTYKFEPAIPALKILSFTFIPVMMSHSLEALLLARRNEKFMVFSMLLSAAVMIAGIFLNAGSLVSICFAVLIGETVLALSYFFQLLIKFFKS